MSLMERSRSRMSPTRLAERAQVQALLPQVYEQLRCPVQVLHDQDAYTDFAMLPEMTKRPGWSAIRITPTRGLPQFEERDRTVAALNAFWAPLDTEDARMDQAEGLQPGY